MSFIIKKIISFSNRNIELKNEETPSEWTGVESEDGSEDIEYLMKKDIEKITEKNREYELNEEKIQSAIGEEIIQYVLDNKSIIKQSLSYDLAQASIKKLGTWDYEFRRISRSESEKKWHGKLGN